jgi:hypothetical protein
MDEVRTRLSILAPNTAIDDPEYEPGADLSIIRTPGGSLPAHLADAIYIETRRTVEL